MAIHIMLTTLAEERPQANKVCTQYICEVNREVENIGMQITSSITPLLGQYDFSNILEALNNESVSRVAIESGSRGTVRTVTRSAVDLDNFIHNLI